MLNRVSTKWLIPVAALVLVAAAFLVFSGGAADKTATLHFSRTVSTYKGTEVRVMGVRIGSVTSVVPQGKDVKVEITYDHQYKLPADAKAAIVTPTLVADRFVQIAPAYTGGPALADGGEISLADSATPVELDQIYQSLADLTTALGPNGANKDGSLNRLLAGGAKALEGNGALGNRTLTNLSAAVQTFADNSGPMFSTVRNLNQVTTTLAANDAFVSRFMGDLASVSAQLAGERGDLAKALAALSSAIGTVRSFVHNNKSLLISDIKKLTDVLGVLAKEKDSMNTFTRLGALGIENLNLAYDVPTGSIGSRVQVGPTAERIDNALCDVVANAGVPNSATICSLLQSIISQIPNSPAPGARTAEPAGPALLKLAGNKPPTSLAELINALRKGAKQ